MVFSSCVCTKLQCPLRLQDASYQTWDAGTKHRGTQVEVILVGDVKHIEIIELVFRNKSMVPTVKHINGSLILMANFESGTEKISEYRTVGSKVDKLVYTHKGNVYELPLKDIQRKPMKYYPKQ